MDIGGRRAYQLVVTSSRDMIKDLARVVLSPPDEAIAAS
jgi:hypothetical protein